MPSHEKVYKGRVVHADHGTGVPGAFIMAGRSGTRKRTQSDASGAFCLRIHQGEFVVRVVATGFERTLATVPERTAPDREWTIRLRPASEPAPAFEGKVLDGLDGRPLPGARITLEAEDWNAWTVTDETGAFSLPGPRAGEFARLSVQSSGYHEFHRLYRGATGAGEIRLVRFGRMTLRFLDADGKPERDLWVSFQPDPMPPRGLLGSALTNRDGEVEVPRLPLEIASRVRIYARGSWENNVQFCALLRAEELAHTGTREFRLPETRTVEGTVVDAAGNPLDEGELRIFPVLPGLDGESVSEVSVAIEEGRFAIENVSAGEWRGAVLKDDRLLWRGSLSTAQAPRIALPVPSELACRVLDREGRPVRAAGLSLWLKDDQVRAVEFQVHGETDASGRCVLGNLPPGAYRLTASRSDLGARMMVVHLGPGGTPALEIRLPSWGTVKGTVDWPRGSLRECCLVQVTPGNGTGKAGSPPVREQILPQGAVSFTIHRLDPGGVRLRLVRGNRTLCESGSLEIQPGDTTRVTLSPVE
jgi:protocatechuate 3,4-dioxygenase beta subunit